MHGVIELSPLAVAGWVGVLVTSLNLLPLAQLDGGHIAFAMFGRAQAWVARVVWLVLIVLGYFWWWGWWLWAVLGLLIGRGRLTHPPVIAPERPLDHVRMAVGWLAFVLFVVTFMPLPIAG
jgi:membrane-associated protease RseP (regulator of RpoE activity)